MVTEKKSIIINKKLYQDIRKILDNRRKSLINTIEDFQRQVNIETDEDWRTSFNYAILATRKEFEELTDTIVYFDNAYKKGYRV